MNTTLILSMVLLLAVLLILAIVGIVVWRQRTRQDIIRKILNQVQSVFRPKAAESQTAKAYLVVLAGIDTKQGAIPLRGETTRLGRDGNLVNIVLLDASVSRLHAKIVEEHDGAFKIYDEGSGSGTYVNQDQVSVQGRRLREGDRIALGRDEFLFKLELVSNEAAEFFDRPPSVSADSTQEKPYVAAPAAPPRTRDRVLFSTYHPLAVEPNVPYTVVAYAFREWASPLVLTDARMRTASMGVNLGATTQTAKHAIPSGALVTAILELPGFRINPARITVRFEDAWSHMDFEIRATNLAPLDHYVMGQLTFMMDGVIVADLGLTIYVSSQTMPNQVDNKSTEPYQAVFCSYSHKDIQIVERVEHVCQALGMKYLRDVTTLRSGERFDERLLQLIDQANIFQLFWSESAAQSPWVEKEWTHALTLLHKGEAFIRPVYWKQPLTLPPPQLAPIHFAYCPELAE